MPTILPERVEPDRLRLERLSHETVDARELYRSCPADEDIDQVTAYMPWDPHGTVKETWEFVDRCEDGWERDERATYAIRPRDGEEGAGEPAGTTALAPDWDRKTAGLGVWLRKRFWGRGYSGERAAALIEVAFEGLDLELVEVTHQAGNENSRRAIEKCVEARGGRHEGRLRHRAAHGDDPADVHRYTISREEYREATNVPG